MRFAAGVDSILVVNARTDVCTPVAFMPRRTKLDLAQLPLNSRDFRKLIDRDLSEAKYQKQVEEAMRALGWWFNHNPSNVIVCQYCHRKNYRGIAKGIPDLWAIREPTMLFLELKDERNTLEPEQRTLLDRIKQCTRIISTWARPRDRERVMEILEHPERHP